MAPLPREPIRSTPLRSHELKFALGGLMFHKDLVFEGWQFTPSIGLVAKDIDRLGLDIRSFKEPLTRSIKRVIIPSIRKNFEVGGRPAWEPLSEATIKLRGYEAWPILVRTGALKRGATQFNIWDVSQTSAAIRKLPDKVWYGVVHQQGSGGFGSFMSKAGKELGKGARASDVVKRAYEMMDEARGGASGQRAVRIPQRQFVLFQEDDIDAIQLVFYEWLVERTIAVGRFSK